jgi:uncharacterized repeat protein (TIGR03803 family)
MMRTRKLWIPGLSTIFLVACGGGNDGGGQPLTYTVGGSITGLIVTGLKLASGSNLISPAANATSFVFSSQLTSGASYSVTVQTNPIGLICTVSSGAGTVGSTDVTDIAVTCIAAVPAETNLHYFGTGTDGANPAAALIQGTDGNFYGTTYGGGAGGTGTVFKITPVGVETALYSFTGKDGDGANPKAALIQGTDGNFYGTTYYGGTTGTGASSAGTVFKITPAGVETVIYSFTGKNGDGANPAAGLIQDADGNFYGTTYFGGSTSVGVFGPGSGLYSSGTVFKITATGVETVLHSFTGSTGDGSNPAAGLILGADGNFYGTTYYGGTPFQGPQDAVILTAGTVFKITPAGVETVLISFNFGDGENPSASLIQGSDGNFYGTTPERRQHQ